MEKTTCTYVKSSELLLELAARMQLDSESMAAQFFEGCSVSFGDSSHTLINLAQIKKELDACEDFQHHPQADSTWDSLADSLKKEGVAYVDLES